MGIQAIRRRSLLSGAAAASMVLGAPIANAEAKARGTLSYSYDVEPTALCTIATTEVAVAIAATKIIDSLLEYEGPGLTPKPGIAQSWVVSEDGLSYTFKLRPGVKWQDGKDFTSADVKFSVEKVIRPYHARGRIYYRQLAGVDTPDPLTVVFRLKKPVPFFLKAFQPSESPMLPEHLLANTDLTKIRQSSFMRSPVGTGPFRLKEWKRGSYLIFERNPYYWKAGHPYLDQIIVRVIPDDNARVVALQNGEINLAAMNAVPPSSLAQLKREPKLVASHAGNEGLGPVVGLICNLRRKPLDDVRVRQAISLAIDRQKIADVIFFGQGTPATNPIIKANPVFYNTALKPYPFDPAKAKALLDAAGYPVRSGGHRFTLTLANEPHGPLWQRLGEYVRLALGAVGISITLQNQDMGTFLQQVFGQWDFDLASLFLNDYSDPSIVLEQAYASWAIQKGGTFNNAMGYRNARVDALLRQASVEMDLAKRKELYFEVEQILHDEQPEIFLIDMFYTSVWNKRVRGLITNGISMYSGWDSVTVE